MIKSYGSTDNRQQSSYNNEEYRHQEFPLNQHTKRIIYLVAVIICASFGYFSYLGTKILDEIRIHNENNKLHYGYINSKKILKYSHNEDFFSFNAGLLKALDNKHFENTELRQKKNVKSLRVLIVYLKDHKHSELMAEEIQRGIHSYLSSHESKFGIEVILKEPQELTNFSIVLSADAIILGSPVYNANIHPHLLQWIDSTWDITEDLSTKVGAAFVTAGGISAGEEATMISLLRVMLTFNMIIVGGGDWKSPFGASAIINEEPFEFHANMENHFGKNCYRITEETEVGGHDAIMIHEMFLQKAFKLGKRVAKTLAMIKVSFK